MNGTYDYHQARHQRPQPIRIRNASEYEGRPVPDRQWLIPSILIRRGITMLSGAGGVGKSLLCLQLQVAAALGQPWLGIPLDGPMNSFGLYCEDDEEEIHRRLYDICRSFGCSFSDLDGRVRFAARVGEQNELMIFNWKKDNGQRTALLGQIEDEIKMFSDELIIIDTVADTFLGNENIRPQVRAFVNAIRRLALINNGGVIITAHPSRTGLADGSGLSGSTAWEGSVRNRIYFTKPKGQGERDAEGDEEQTDERILKTMKSNYGPAGDKIRMKWQQGAFVRTDIAGTGGGGFVERLEINLQLMKAAEYLVQRGSMLAADPNAKTSLVVVARNLPSCKHLSWGAALAAQERLIENGKLVMVELGPPSKRRMYIRPAHLRYPGEDGGK